jgi:AraC-like DNA-binding protein
MRGIRWEPVVLEEKNLTRRSIFETSTIAAPDRFDAWMYANSETFVALDVVTPNPTSFSGSLISQEIGLVRVAEVTGPQITVRRTAKNIAKDDLNLMKFGLQLRGRGVVSQDGREAFLNPGDLALYDTTRPYELRFDGDFCMLVVIFHADHLAVGRKARDSLMASRIPARHGVAALTYGLLSSLAVQLHEGDAAGDFAVSEALLAMISGTSAEHIGEHLSPSIQQTLLLSRIDGYIDAHLGDPAMTVSGIAVAQNISVRYLQKLFETRADTVSDRIRRSRLARCREDLMNPRLNERSVSSIGLRWGFSDAAVFSRAFRSNFGTSPAEFRRLTQGVI